MRADLQGIEKVLSLLPSPTTTMKYLMVDETYIGKRLHNRGERTRKERFWLMTATDVNPSTGKSMQIYWEATTTRTKVNLHAFVQKVIEGTNSTVITDDGDHTVVLVPSAGISLFVMLMSSSTLLA